MVAIRLEIITMNVTKKPVGSRYIISSDGKLFSKEYKYEIHNQTGGTGKYRIVPERELKGSKNTFGYKQVNIDGQLKYIHRLVAEQFIPNPKRKPQVNHKDGNKLNNSITNLEWVTISENIKHAFDTGLNRPMRGSCNGNSVNSEATVKKVYILAKYKIFSQEKIGNLFNVPQITVSNIKTTKTWKHITDIIDDL